MIGGVLRKPTPTVAGGVIRRAATRMGGVIRPVRPEPVIKLEERRAPAGRASKQVALTGRDGDKAEELLQRSKWEGIATIADMCESAIRRLVRGRNPLKAKELFTEAERKELADTLAAVNSTAELLGRSRIRLRQQRAEDLHGAKKFSEEGTSWEVFKDEALKPKPPEEALKYFKKLVPRIGVDPGRFGPLQERSAFTLAADTEGVILDKVQNAITSMLETGKGIDRGGTAIQEIMDAAGVSHRNSQYSEMVMRTNMKDSYATGSMKELQDPDVVETFPVWKFSGVRDGRQRPAHEQWFDKYFPNHASFAAVRDSIKGDFDGYNCRCDFIAVDKWEWAELQKAGFSVEEGW
jgi:hypothetical protein